MSSSWWKRCTAIKRYMPGEDGLSAAQIIAELDAVADCGYQAIQVTAPYASAGFYPWWGLRPADYFQINRVLGGSMEDFCLLVRECHRRGLKILAFLNLGYADVTAALWKKACYDVRNGIDSPERQYFRWSRTGTESLRQPGTPHFKQGGKWVWSAEAQRYYWCHWERDGYAEPQYDWASPAFRDYAGRVLRFWMDTGLDGIILDAVNWYLNCDWKTIRTCAVDIIHSYPGAMCIPEGGSGFGDDPLAWLTQGGFDAVEDQAFDSDLDWNGSAVIDAVETGDAGILVERLAAHERVRAAGGVSWSYPSWHETAWTMPRRLLELALLLGTGHMTEIIPAYLAGSSPQQTETLWKLLRASRHPGLVPMASCRPCSTDSRQVCAFVRATERDPVLCVFQVGSKVVTASVCLDDSGIGEGAVLRNLLDGSSARVIGWHFTVSLPPLGFGFYVVETER